MKIETQRNATPVEQLAALNLSFSDPARSAAALPWHADGPGSSNLALLKFVTNSAQRWDAPQSQMVQIFAIAAGLGDGSAYRNYKTLCGLTAPAPKTTTA